MRSKISWNHIISINDFTKYLWLCAQILKEIKALLTKISWNQFFHSSSSSSDAVNWFHGFFSKKIIRLKNIAISPLNEWQGVSIHYITSIHYISNQVVVVVHYIFRAIYVVVVNTNILRTTTPLQLFVQNQFLFVKETSNGCSVTTIQLCG